MKKVLALICLLGLLIALAALAGTLPRFSDHRASGSFTGAPVMPDFSTAPHAKKFIGQIREGVRKGPNFAGRYTVVDWGCGSGCQTFVIVDAKTGAIFQPDITTAWGLLYKRDSNLLITNPINEEVLAGSPPPDWLVSRYYTWDGKKLTQIAENRTAIIDPETGAAQETAEPPKKRTVIDYFNLIRNSEEKIRSTDGKWTVSVRGESVDMAVADIPNGYLEYTDAGTGGGSTVVTAALFMAGNGEPMLAKLEAARTTGMCPDPTYVLRVYHMDMDLMDTVRKVVPDLPVSLFMKKGYDPKKSAPGVVLDRDYRVGYKLPRKGTTVEAFLDASNLSCGMAMAGDMPKKERQEKEEFLRNVKKEAVKLKWNRATGMFDLQTER